MLRFVPCRTLLLAIVLTVTTAQAAKPPAPTTHASPKLGKFAPAFTATQIAQIVTAVLSLPITLAKQAKPQAKGYQLLEHCIKALNAGLAMVNNQGNGWINVPWFLYDFTQGTRMIGALLTGSELSETSFENIVLAAAQAESQASVSEDDEDQTKISNSVPHHTIGALLATIEAGMRIGVALDIPKSGSITQEKVSSSYRYILANISSMARLAHCYLCAATKDRQQWFMRLLIVNAAGLIFSIYQYNIQKPQLEEQCHVMAHLAEQQPLNTSTNNAAFNYDTFTTCFEEMAKDADYLSPNASIVTKNFDAFCTRYQIAPFFSQNTETGKRYRQHFMSFATVRLTNPNDVKEHAHDVANEFRTFADEQEQVLAPIRARLPLLTEDEQPNIPAAFDYDAFTTCCKTFVLQGHTYNDPIDFINAFAEFCEQHGIANLFDTASPLLNRHRDHLTAYWNENMDWMNNPFVKLPLNVTVDYHETPMGRVNRLRYESNQFTVNFEHFARVREDQPANQGH